MKDKIIYENTIVTRSKPVNLKPGEEFIFEHEFEKKLPASYLNKYKNVQISYDGIIFKNNIIVKDAPLIGKKDFQSFKYRYYLSILFKKKQIKLSKNKTYLLVFDRFSKGYFHYLTDFLTRLIEVSDYLETCTFLLPDYFKIGFTNKLLESFDIKDIVYFKPNEKLKVPELIVPDYIAPSGNYNIQNINKLQQYLLNHFKPKVSDNRISKYYISRAKATRRFILNEKELNQLLEKFGYQTIYFEDYTIEEEIEIAFNAQRIISSHGANLTNCLFMQPGSKILEFRKKDDYTNHAYYSLVSALNVDYFYQQCDYVDRQKGNYFDLIVDLKVLEENLKLMG